MIKITIGLNYLLISNSSEEKTVLAEELSHYHHCETLYNSNYSNEEISEKSKKILLLIN